MKISSKSNWRVVRFGDAVRQVKERVDPEMSGLTRYIAGEHMDTDDLRIRRWGEIGDGYLGPAFHMRFKPGQVLYGSRRTYLRKVAVPHFEGICANTTYVLESRDPRILLPELLPFIMQTEAFHEHSIQQSKGSVNPYINFSDLEWYEFALPPLEEQERVVEVLQSANQLSVALTNLHESALSLLSSIRRSEFDPEKNKTISLRKLCSDGDGIQIGPFGAQLHKSDYMDEGIPVVMPTNMNNDRIDVRDIARVSEEKAEELNIHRVLPGDILLPRRGELDRRAYVEKKQTGWLCGTGSLRIRVDEGIPPRLIFHAIASPHVVRWLTGNAVGTTMPNLNSSIVGRIPIAFPPTSRQSMVLETFDTLTHQLEFIQIRLEEAVKLKNQILRNLIGE